jgi:hypothetical protein
MDGVAPLTTLENTVAKDQPGSSEAGTIEVVQEGSRSAVALDGDNALVFPKSGVFSRTQEFTICLDLKIPSLGPMRARAVINC